jgi:probable O-glycosylation ligase (exosortase A-associated)
MWLRHGLLVCTVLIMLSILGSYSRGAFLGLAAVSIYLVYKSRQRWTLLPILLALGAVSLAFLPKQWFERVETIQTYEEDASAMGRINSWYFAFNLAKDRPLVGGGYDSFTPNLFERYAPDPEDFHDAHSIYFEVLGEQGFIGLALFLTLGWLAFRQGNRIRKLCKDRHELHWAFDLASMVQVCLVGYAVAGAFVGLAYFDLYYHLLAMLVITQVLVNRTLKSPSQVDVHPVADADGRPAVARPESRNLAGRSQ